MSFNFENGEWVEGERVKKPFNLDEWKWPILIILADLALWWWFGGFHYLMWRMLAWF